MSAFGGKADIALKLRICPLMTQSGQRLSYSPLGMPFRSEAISMINQRIWLGELLECRGIVNDDVAP